MNPTSNSASSGKDPAPTEDSQTQSAKDAYRKEVSVWVDSKTNEGAHVVPLLSSAVPGGSAAKKQANTEAFFDRPLAKNELGDFERLLADMFVSGNFSFRAVEDPRFIRFWKFMRPAVKPPSRFVLSTRIIPQRIKSVESNTVKALSSQLSVTVTLDGYKNAKHDKVLGIMATVKNSQGVENHFLSTEIISSQSSRAEDVMEKIEGSFTMLEQKFKACARTVTCDSDAAHVKARRLMKEKYPSKIFLPCSAHQINLIVKDVLTSVPKFSAICKKAVDIVSLLATRTKALAVLREEQMKYNGSTTAISKLCDTRWYSYNNMFRAIAKSQLPLQGMVARLADERSKTEGLAKLKVTIEDAAFWSGLKNVVQILDPVTVAQGITETDGCTLADVITQFAKIYHVFTALEDDDLAGVLGSTLEKRWQKFYDPSLFVLALILDPTSKMKPFRTSGRFNFGVVLRWAKGWYVRLFEADGMRVISSLMDYIENKGIFGDEVASNLSSVERYWKYVQYEHKELASLVLELWHVVVHAASLERAWSQLGFVHDDNRSNLKLDLATGMVAMRMKFQKEDIMAKREAQRVAALKESLKVDLQTNKKSSGTVVEMDEDGDIQIISSNNNDCSTVSDSEIQDDASASSQFNSVLEALLEFEECTDDEINDSVTDFYSLSDLFGVVSS
ncbi:uncharacterized protein LOC129598367 [Paramacrobiotus metropolitanus]|uniref:uncharacterized protein LOC129598367 n=1 Tax=Paramacrobiotus metropolitanus TaxID=2943436 RepID=UPI002445B506|nr:uncharacterized protein LOC129598367 [Paramacrobiotus metropolitanus]